MGTTTPGWNQKLQQGSNPRSMLIHGFIHILLSVPGMSFNNKHVGSEVTAFLFWAGLSVCLYLGDTGTFQEASLALWAVSAWVVRCLYSGCHSSDVVLAGRKQKSMSSVQCFERHTSPVLLLPVPLILEMSPGPSTVELLLFLL